MSATDFTDVRVKRQQEWKGGPASVLISVVRPPVLLAIPEHARLERCRIALAVLPALESYQESSIGLVHDSQIEGMIAKLNPP